MLTTSQIQKEKLKMSELVDRQEVLKVIREMNLLLMGCSDTEALLDAIKGLPSAQPDIDKQELLRMITRGIFATSDKDIYSCGIRNGMRWCMALLEEDAPKFEDASLYVRQERKKGEWIKMSDADGIYYACSECGESIPRVPDFNPQFDVFPRLESLEKTNFCHMCGADMREEKQNG